MLRLHALRPGCSAIERELAQWLMIILSVATIVIIIITCASLHPDHRIFRIIAAPQAIASALTILYALTRSRSHQFSLPRALWLAAPGVLMAIYAGLVAVQFIHSTDPHPWSQAAISIMSILVIVLLPFEVAHSIKADRNRMKAERDAEVSARALETIVVHSNMERQQRALDDNQLPPYTSGVPKYEAVAP
ncbi:hypothetical protein CPB97_011669 [Podila verticillata]|nr:hypothetical protein CPB97_011669 [Podila verticillata]